MWVSLMPHLSPIIPGGQMHLMPVGFVKSVAHFPPLRHCCVAHRLTSAKQRKYSGQTARFQNLRN